MNGIGAFGGRHFTRPGYGMVSSPGLNPLYQGYGMGLLVREQQEAVVAAAAVARGRALQEEWRRRQSELVVGTRRDVRRINDPVDEMSDLLEKCALDEESTFANTQRSIQRMQTMRQHDIQETPKPSHARRMQTTVQQHRDIQSVSATQQLERYERNLSLLMQEFVAKARHEFVLTGKWPTKAEDAALQLASRLDGLDWEHTTARTTYLDELDESWMARAPFTNGQQVFQVVWEYVAGKARKWDVSNKQRLVAHRAKNNRPAYTQLEWTTKETRHQECYNPTNRSGNETIYLPRVPSMTRQQNLYQRNEYRQYRREVRFPSQLRGPRPPIGRKVNFL